MPPQSTPVKYCPSCGQILATHMQQCGRCKALQPGFTTPAAAPVRPVPQAPSPIHPPEVTLKNVRSAMFSPPSDKAKETGTVAGVIVAFFFILYIFFSLHNPLLPNSYSIKSKVHEGETVNEVEEVLGKPSSYQDMDGSYMRMQMLYYPASDGQVQLVFTNGRLSGFNKY